MLKAWGLPVLADAVVGAMLARSAEPELLQIVFAGVAGFLSVKLISGTSQWRLRDTLPGKVAMSMCGILLGLISALMGIEYHL